ncbi:MAG: NADPH:quinone oxidoreductase family protein [Neomegalonema sp.]|nr:NADPH:quinone oxidoreductase family protein [Neomegalonema sp.]
MTNEDETQPVANKAITTMSAPAFNAPLAASEVQLRAPSAGEIRVKVAGCGVNFADTLLVAGKYQERLEPPITPGLEISGVIEAVGDGAMIDGRPASPGMRVAAMCQRGMAEYAIADSRAAAPAPEALDLIDAAAAPVAYGTGLVALRDRARLAPGERLLVTGAAGGVGLTAVELGKLLGAEVIAAARGAEKCAIAAAKGADHVIDTDKDDLRTVLKGLGGIDVAYETVGGDVWDATFRAARPGARLLPIGFAGGGVPQIPANVLLVKNITIIGFYWGGWMALDPSVFGDALKQIFAWIVDGRLKPEVTRMPLAQAEQALNAVRERRAVGKLVLTP